MLIIGCDFDTRYQQIVMMDEATGESDFHFLAAGWRLPKGSGR